ncbi:hypothetical protein [Parerythrobacter aestuarii]|uniref:hypothetical protein n=1 Tax=Parerythrobacter aestuarii TaxID=3020909 RepID=UPI0024DEF883|nr:hypothetical protein [Parerythrobacter aestuarii]
MRRTAILLAVPALIACSPPGDAETADDYAGRIGASGVTTPNQQPAAAVAAPALPAGVQATQLQRLGDIGSVDLGQRTGGCTFMEVGREVFFTSGNPQSGKGVIRVGGELVTVDAKGNVDAIKTGTTFSAPGVSISVAPAAGNETRRPANMVVTDAGGVTQSYSGDWICG